MELYEGVLQLGAPYDDAVFLAVLVPFMTDKRKKTKHTLSYTTCKSQTCEYMKKKECPIPRDALSGRCHCPNGTAHDMNEPRAGSNAAFEFRRLLDKVRIRQQFGKYSAFIHEHMQQEMPRTVYEKLRDLPEFAIQKMTTYFKSNADLYADLDERKQLVSTTRNSLVPRFQAPFFSSFARFVREDIEAYLKALNDDGGEADPKQRDWERKTGPLFIHCGEFIFVKIPWLSGFEAAGMKDVFVYPEGGGFFSRSDNAVRTEDFDKLEGYLLNHDPRTLLMGDRITDYRQRYVPYIRKEMARMRQEIARLVPQTINQEPV